MKVLHSDLLSRVVHRLVDHPFFMAPFLEGESLKKSEVYDISLIITGYGLYFINRF
jgi:hypothetical protein